MPQILQDLLFLMLTLVSFVFIVRVALRAEGRLRDRRRKILRRRS